MTQSTDDKVVEVRVCRGWSASWIGLYKYSASSTDQSPSAQYWLDNSTSTFRRWSYNEPDENTQCVLLKPNGEFEDKDCGYEKRFVCKRTNGLSV